MPNYSNFRRSVNVSNDITMEGILNFNDPISTTTSMKWGGRKFVSPNFSRKSIVANES